MLFYFLAHFCYHELARSLSLLPPFASKGENFRDGMSKNWDFKVFYLVLGRYFIGSFASSSFR